MTTPKLTTASLLTDEDAARFNLGLSGDEGIQLMLGALKVHHALPVIQHR
jgi:hypothetical protein